jgi:DNA-binding NarL/FixJ family response regulator
VSPTPIRVMLIEDHTVVRQGFEALLRDQPDMAVVAQAADGEKALEQVETARPHVALVDISLPGMNGLEVTRRLKKLCPECKVLMLTVHADKEYVVQAFRSGAMGYLVKDADAQSVLEAVRQVAEGRNYMTPLASEALIERTKMEHHEDVGPTDRLTQREMQVWKLIGQGMKSGEIAEALDISVKTVQTHRNNLMNKLGVHDQTSLVKEAIRRGIVRLDD